MADIEIIIGLLLHVSKNSARIQIPVPDKDMNALTVNQITISFYFFYIEQRICEFVYLKMDSCLHFIYFFNV